MIHKMREMAPVIMLVILVSFVGGTIFLNWGMNLSDRGSKAAVAGKINGKEVQLNYFDQLVNRERQRLQEGGKEVPPEQYRMVPQQVWEREVNKRLMKDVVGKLKIEATAEEVFSYIKRNPLPGIDTVSVFQTDGVFDTSKYEQFLNDPQNYQQYRWLQEVESYTASTIIPAQNLEALLGATAVPTPSEAGFQYEKKNRKVVFEYLKAKGTDFKVDSSNITDAMVATYYSAHRDSFKTDEQADLYYVKFPKVATDADVQFYRQELLDLKKRIEQSDLPLAEAFGEEAKIESDDETCAAQGGDLGWFARGSMVKAFDSVAFEIPVGIVSEPVKTSFGWHLIYVEAREEKDSVLKVHARHILRKISPTMETLDMLAEHADSLRSKMLDQGFVEVAKAEKGIVFDSTGLFEKGEQIPGIGYISGSGHFTFGNSDVTISERMENTDAIYLLMVKRKIDKGTLPLEAARERITALLGDSLQVAAAGAYLAKMRESLPDTMSLAAYHTVDSTIVSGVTDTVSGSQYISQIGFSSPVVAKAMSLPEGTFSDIITYKGDCYLIKTLWKSALDSLPAFESPEMMQIASQLQQQSRQQIYFQWYMHFKNKAKIQCNVNDFYMD
ncbi:MAG: SurA N-terminal domain-containing protein [Chitinispirillaceae bacterium]|nr:SurA N-terminal domain-containing protein [Chitinispirillaceae bacterium]